MIHGLGLVFFAVAWLMPGHYFPWASFQQELAAAFGAALIGLSCLVRQRGQSLAMPAIATVALALAAVPMVQWGFGKVHFLNDALLPALYLVAFALVVVGSRALASDSDSPTFSGSVKACSQPFNHCVRARCSSSAVMGWRAIDSPR